MDIEMVLISMIDRAANSLWCNGLRLDQNTGKIVIDDGVLRAGAWLRSEDRKKFMKSIEV